MSTDLIKKNGFTLKKADDSVKTIIDADYVDDQALLTNTPTQAESLLHSLEQAAWSSGLYMNANNRVCVSNKKSHLH